MFAVNGPSGPTQRYERRAKSERQKEEEAATRSRVEEAKRANFFSERRAKSESSKSGEKEKQEHQPESGIFKGCRVVFNGRTGKVSSYYLAKLVKDHGGNVASTLSSTRVTHMVGSNLSSSKADRVLKSSSKIKFVSPEWILQSVKHKKRLAEFDFLVYKDAGGAASLKAAFSRATAPST